MEEHVDIVALGQEQAELKIIQRESQWTKYHTMHYMVDMKQKEKQRHKYIKTDADYAE